MHALAIVALLAAACGPKQVYSDADVAHLPKLEDVMWSQAQVMDPAFKRVGAASYTDEEFVRFTAAAGRLRLTTARIKQDFSKGPEFNALADALAAQAEALAAASTAKDAPKASAALAATKETCRACHKRFR
jgi:hypothetical protein